MSIISQKNQPTVSKYAILWDKSYTTIREAQTPIPG
jgi:hypothetical protein